MKILILKSAAWSNESFYESKHPEYVAIRNLISRHPEHEFVLIGHGLNYEHFRLEKVSIYNLGSGNKFRYVFSFLMDFLLPLALRPKVIVSMGGVNEIPVAIAGILARAKFIPVIVIDMWYSVSELPSFSKKIINMLLSSSFKSAYVNFAISRSIKKELVNVYKVAPEKVLVYNYEISKIFNPNVPRDLRERLNPNGPIILTVCRISPQKGLQYLIEASKNVIQKMPNVQFIIRTYASEEGYKKQLLDLISKCQVTNNFKIIEEFSKYDEIPRYMVASDIFVLPSISEGFPVVLLEAMSCGVPIIATKVGGIPEVLKEGYNGVLVDPCNADMLAESIIDLLSNEKQLKKLSNGAIKTAETLKENEFEKLLAQEIF